MWPELGGGEISGALETTCSQVTHFLDNSTETQQKLSDLPRLPQLLDDEGRLAHRCFVLNVGRSPGGRWRGRAPTAPDNMWSSLAAPVCLSLISINSFWNEGFCLLFQDSLPLDDGDMEVSSFPEGNHLPLAPFYLLPTNVDLWRWHLLQCCKRNSTNYSSSPNILGHGPET